MNERVPDQQGHTTENPVLVVLCTCPDPKTAERLSAGLVEKDLAACVNILPGIRSVYRWKEAIEKDEETLMVIKTSAGAWSGLERWLRTEHPYDVPEILALPVRAGSAGYLDWVENETRPREHER